MDTILKNRFADSGIEIAHIFGELLLQMRPRKLQGHELMMIIRFAGRAQWFLGDGVVAGSPPKKFAVCARCSHRTATIEIQTKLNALRVEAAAPVE